MARIIGIQNGNTTPETTVYDPTCGSGSLLLKVADEAVTLQVVARQTRCRSNPGRSVVESLIIIF
jgi:hypothetical protein